MDTLWMRIEWTNTISHFEWRKKLTYEFMCHWRSTSCCLFPYFPFPSALRSALQPCRRSLLDHATHKRTHTHTSIVNLTTTKLVWTICVCLTQKQFVTRCEWKVLASLVCHCFSFVHSISVRLPAFYVLIYRFLCFLFSIRPVRYQPAGNIYNSNTSAVNWKWQLWWQLDCLKF